MDQHLGSGTDGTSIHQIVEDLLGERIEALASWIQELDAQVRTTAASGDEKTLKELRKALEAWTKRDPKFEERLTERVDVLADRLATLSATVSTTTAARASSEGELAVLRRELEQETAKLHKAVRGAGATDVSRDIDELRRAVADMGRAPRTNGDAGGASREELENIGARIDMLAKTVATTANGLAGREGDLASLRRSLEDTNSRLDQIATSLPRASDGAHVARLESRLAEIAKAVDDATRATTERERSVAALRSSVEDQAAKLQAFAASVRESTQALQERVAEVAARDDTSAAVAEVDARVASLADQIAAQDTRFDDVRARLDSVSLQLVDLSADRAGGIEEIAALRRQIDESGIRFDAAVAELRGLLDALPTEPSLAEVDARLAPLRTQLDEVATKSEGSGERYEAALAELRQRLDAIQAESSSDDLDARLGPLEGQLEALAARVVEADGRIGERLARETSRSSTFEQRLDAVHERLEEVAQRQDANATEAETARSGAELERAWVREQMDAVVSAVADTATRADVDPLERRLQALADEQTALTAELTRMRETVLAETERLEGELRSLPAPSNPAADLEPLMGDLTRRVQELASEQSARAEEIASTHEQLRAEIARVDAALSDQPEPSVPIPPSEDEQLKQLLTVFADRIDAMEHERATIADEAAEAARGRADQVRPLVEGLRRRLDESDRRLEALGPTDELNGKLDELAERIQALEKRPVAAPQPAPLPGDGRFRVELRALDLRMQHAEAAARENREAVLVQLERLASRIEWRLQRLESGEQPELEEIQEEPSLGQVVPLRGGAENT